MDSSVESPVKEKLMAPDLKDQEEEDRINEAQWVAYREEQQKKPLPSIGQAIGCEHPHLDVIQFGTSFYLCPDCMHVIDVPSSKLMPFNHLPRYGLGLMGAFARRQGMPALWDNLAQSHALQDGSGLHGPMLPEGQTPVQFLAELHDKWNERMALAERNEIALPTQAHMEIWNTLCRQFEIAQAKEQARLAEEQRAKGLKEADSDGNNPLIE